MADYHYEGEELAIFAHAHNWKQYWISQLAPFVKGDVLEVGAGIGSNTAKLRSLSAGRWLCLEPDERLLSELRGRVATNLFSPVDVICGTVDVLPEDQLFDTALYIDVLEHISDDVAEIGAVARHLRGSGHIIVLSPAHQILYSPFDRAIGHQRRYNRASLLRCTPPSAQPILVSYLDSAGYLLSLANRMILQQSSPTLEQILFWNKYIVPVSRLIDPLLGFRFGKSILGVWQVGGEPSI
jgi:ubiquinone/menaquinone biosynthesis C-methylase UbiE